jgi:radical SAM superfamily enzyme YgiQ (UPF0313 family)
MGRIKILPVYPEYPKDTFWSYSHTVKLMGRKASMPPLGLITAMAMFPQDIFDVMPVADMNTRILSDDEIRRADLVMTSSMVVQGESLEKLIARTHSLGKKVVSGGPHPTAFADKIGADHLIVGEGEIAIPEFVRDIRGGRNLRKRYIPGECSREGISFAPNGFPLLDKTPLPRWDLINMNDYYSMAIQFSRGCPWVCDFCDIPELNGKIPRTKSPNQMVRELDALRANGWEKGAVFVVDDNFIGNKRDVRKVLPEMEKWQMRRGFPYAFYTEASMDLALPENKDILEGLVNAGYNMVFLGIESPDPIVLGAMGKRNNRGNLSEKVRTILNHGLEVTGGFIVGNDNDRPDIFDKMYDFIQDAGIVTPMPGILTAMRGTPLYNRMKAEGRLRAESGGNNTHDLKPNFVPKMNEDNLVDGYVSLLQRLFDPKNYYERCRTAQESLGPNKTGHVVDSKALTAVAKLVAHNFVRGDWEFFKYIGDTVVNRPGRINQAFADGIRFHHLHKITDDIAKTRRYQLHTQTLYEQVTRRIGELKEGAGHSVSHARELATRALRDAEERLHGMSKSVRAKAQPYYEGLREKLRKYIH